MVQNSDSISAHIAPSCSIPYMHECCTQFAPIRFMLIELSFENLTLALNISLWGNMNLCSLVNLCTLVLHGRLRLPLVIATCIRFMRSRQSYWIEFRHGDVIPHSAIVAHVVQRDHSQSQDLVNQWFGWSQWRCSVVLVYIIIVIWKMMKQATHI